MAGGIDCPVDVRSEDFRNIMDCARRDGLEFVSTSRRKSDLFAYNLCAMRDFVFTASRDAPGVRCGDRVEFSLPCLLSAWISHGEVDLHQEA